MGNAKYYVDEILEGNEVEKVLNKPVQEGSVYDFNWEKSVWDAAKDVHAAAKKLWDLMAFAPDKYFHDECQDALNAFSKWYQDFLKVKEVE